MVRPTVLPTGGAGHIGDGAAGIDNHGKGPWWRPKKQSRVEIAAIDLHFQS